MTEIINRMILEFNHRPITIIGLVILIIVFVFYVTPRCFFRKNRTKDKDDLSQKENKIPLILFGIGSVLFIAGILTR